jgi:hypothetical protein
MQRIFASLVLLVASCVVNAQTIKITTASGPCTYTTGAVTSDPTASGQLLATASGAPVGTGCPATTTSTNAPVSYGPASPLTATSTTTVGNAGGPVTFTFQPLNATACTASSVPSGATFSTMCSSAAGCQSQQSLTATLPSNPSTTADAVYTITVSCTGLGSATGVPSSVNPVTVSHTITTSACTTVPSNTTGITNFTQLTGNVSVYRYSLGTTNLDATSFNAIYDTWPGNSAISAVISLPTNKYLAEKFTVPHGYFAGYTGSGLYNAYSINQSTFTAPVSFTISTTCGDFSNPANDSGSTVVAGCWRNLLSATLTAGQSWVQWRSNTTCILHDDTTYYLNMINADISQVHANGTGTATSSKNANCSSTCANSIRNGPGNFGTYTFP